MPSTRRHRAVRLTALALAACALLAGCTTPPRGGFAHDRTTAMPMFPLAISGGPGPIEFMRVAVQPSEPFTELLCSFNIDNTLNAPVWAEARVPTPDGWSPWLRLAETGLLDQRYDTPTSFEGGRVAIDELLLETPTERAEVRVRAGGPIRIHRLDITTTRPDPDRPLPPSPGDRIELPVAFIPNGITDEDLRSRLCSPTSLNMLINHRTPGVEHDRVVELSHDPRHDLYGVWPRAIQAAWALGVPGHLARFGDWDEVRAHLRDVGPIAISITAGPGEVGNMPYDPGGGHIIVLSGLTESGDAIVLDPALSTDAQARRVYPADDLTTVWLQRKRGTAYVLLSPGPERSASRP